MLKDRGFADQVDSIRRELGWLRKRLTNLTPPVQSDLVRVGDSRDRLVRLLANLEKEEADLASLLRVDGLYSQDEWCRLSEATQRLRALAADSMALDQTVKFRTKTASADLHMTADVFSLFNVADKIAEDLSRKVGLPRSHYILLSESEHFSAESSAIHLGYGHLNVWRLNRVIHEFAHLWAEECASGPNGVQSKFVRALDGKWEEPLAKELFADITATFLAGPAYAYSCLFLDFNPANRLKSDTHPSHEDRAQGILLAMKKIALHWQGFTAGQMAELYSELSDYWSQSRAGAGAGGAIAYQENLKTEIGIILAELDTKIAGAKYESLSKANLVRNALKSGAMTRPGDTSDIDILNGAWLRRLQTDRDDELAIGRAALSMLLNAEG